MLERVFNEGIRNTDTGSLAKDVRDLEFKVLEMVGHLGEGIFEHFS